MNLFERLLLATVLFLLMILCSEGRLSAGPGLGAGPNGNPAAPRAPGGGPWPQWRGPGGLGVSSEQNLPEIWSSNSENIRWKTRIPGEGNSSPVVSNGRVILTTAYESPRAATLQRFTAVVTSGLAFVFLVGVVVRFFRKRRERAQNKIPLVRRGLAGWFSVLFSGFASLCFICFALLVTVGRGHSDLVLGKFGSVLSRLGWTDMMHLCSMAEGVRAAVWLTSGGIALLGLAVCVGWLRAHSIWRLFGGVVVLLSAILLVVFTPLDQWKEEVELWEKLVFLFPGLVVGLWHLSNYFEIGCKQGFEPGKKGTSARPGRIDAALDRLSHLEFRWRHKNIRHFGSIGSLFFVLLLAVLSLLVFVPPNFFFPQTERVVVCVNMETGKMLWEQSVFAAPAERKHTDNTYATPTAAADGRYIVVNFGVGVACLDFEGHILWQESDPDYSKNSRYGVVSSPVLAGDKAIVVRQSEYLTKGLTWIAAFDKQTGRTCWKISPENVRECYTTPLVYRDNDDVQLIIPSFGNVSSFDIESGEYLWMTDIPTEQLVASMARAGTLLCVGGGTWGPKATVMMRLNSTDKGTGADILWKSKRDAPGDCSPVIYDGKLFTVTDTGKMTCYDTVDGTVFWNKRLKGGRYLSSLVAGDGKIYACNTRGLTTVIAAEAEFKILAENDLGGRCYASAAIADGCILLRIADYLYCIEKEHQ